VAFGICYIVSSLDVVPSPDGINRSDLNNYLIQFYSNVFDTWNRRVIQIYESPMLEHVEEDIVEELLSGPESMVFYSAGWLYELCAVERNTLKDLLL